MREDVEGSIRRLHKIAATCDKIPKSLEPVPPPPAKVKIVHRQSSFVHASVGCGMSRRFTHLPECELKRLDGERNARDMERGYELRPELTDANIVRGVKDPFELPKAGSPGNLFSGYGNNRKMFNNVRLNGD